MEINVDMDTYKKIMKHDENDIHYRVEMIPQKSINDLSDSSFDTPKQLLMFLWANANIVKNTVISSFTYGELEKAMYNGITRFTESRIKQSFKTLINNGSVKIQNDLKEKLSD